MIKELKKFLFKANVLDLAGTAPSHGKYGASPLPLS